jgi:hypothetical protein
VQRHLEIEVLDMDQYEVTMAEGSVISRHRVELSEEVLDELGIDEPDGETVVREAFAILLEREPLTAVPPSSTLDRIGALYPYLLPELRQRLAAGSQVRILGADEAPSA